ncbi:MFS transporter [Nitrogeniibacter aestuarii]|uniref:MFS transporter n=1 Tax=Nitrogeniibacter aestuarii TaxID=2815343 RepID=UPI001D112B1D|nr:MFS transporter [Nitrogeniibacter aestuarii]
MRMTVTFGINQIISHGFGLFLFAALVPLMQAEIGITHWHLATIGALTQLAYLGGAMLLGVIGHRIDSGRLMLSSGVVTSVLLFSMASLHDPILMLVALTVMSASAAISWGGIVELVTRYGQPEHHATSLSTASSGTAWGYGLNGLLILLVVPALGWRSGWLAAGVMGLLTLSLTALVLHQIKRGNVQASNQMDAPPVMNTSELFKTIFRERTAFYACLVCFLVGFSAMPFSTWLNTWLAELALPPALGGYAWTMIGISGMAAGFLIGKLADRKGHGLALVLIFGSFALCLMAFLHDPARFAILAGFGYGLMYFPMWGIVAGWVSKRYHSKATMQISGIGMVTFGLGGALGNLLAGTLQELTGSLQAMYGVIGGTSLVLTLLAIRVWLGERRGAPAPDPAH